MENSSFKWPRFSGSRSLIQVKFKSFVDCAEAIDWISKLSKLRANFAFFALYEHGFVIHETSEVVSFFSQ
ncbi:PH domain-containing protein [Asticcacaulis taihuensis]|uniref:Uncharacterized protein n=1 Tax=Asticcacaulis taihuensis TaxID=260084 RepID=A0A1G4RMU2_9CAUL|nr:hypothetical protein SAMN02927928_2082 [Asticcacaulis taihuensis]